MPDAQRHPSADELIAFGQGRLRDEAATIVGRHLETCLECRQVAAQSPVGQSGSSASQRSRAPDPSASDPALNLPPELAGQSKYRIDTELGRGGMGVVFRAVHLQMDRPVAIKVINPTLIHADALPRFYAEVRAAAKLDHPNIVRAYDAEQVGGLNLLVMEYAEGRDLAELVERNGPLSVHQACQCVRQAALGLQHAYEQGMVHRDIKPHNLLLNKKGVVKILDFGLARLRGEKRPGSGLTETGSFLGTPDYVAPEQATDASQADIRADLYSLGCTLYHLLTGQPPFADGTAIVKIVAHLKQAPPPLNDLRPDVPPELAAVAARLLAKDPGERYQKPIELAQAIAPFCKPGSNSIGGIVDGQQFPSPKSKKRDKDRSEFGEAVNPGAAEKEVRAALPASSAIRRSRRLTWRLAGGGIALALLAGLLLGVGFKSRVKTGAGEAYVVVEIDPPDAEIQVDGQKMAVNVPGDSKPIEIQVAAGQHKLRLAKDGFVAQTREIEIHSGKSTPIRIKLEPVPIVAAVSPPSSSSPPATQAESLAPRPPTADSVPPSTPVVQSPSSVTPSAPAAQSPPSASTPEGFVRLFNGKNTQGWHASEGAKSSWRVENGTLIGSGGDGYLITDRSDFENFRLRVEAMLGKGGDSGLCFRVQDNKCSHAYEAQIGAGRFSWSANTGTFVLFEVPGRGSPNLVYAPRAIPSGQWFTMEVLAQGNRFTIWVDGQQTAEYVDQQRLYARGAIALQHLGDKSEVSFRSVEIKELPAVGAPAASNSVPMFNGKDLTGWKKVGGVNWAWANGRLLGRAGSAPGCLISEADYGDFELEFEYRLANRAGSGVFLRCDPGIPPTGGGQFELQIIDDEAFPPQPPINKTGSIYGVFARKVNPPIRRSDWNQVRVNLVGRRIQVWVNETQTVDSNLDTAADQFASRPALRRKSGRIGFQQNQRSDVEYRNVRIRKLD